MFKEFLKRLRYAICTMIYGLPYVEILKNTKIHHVGFYRLSCISKANPSIKSTIVNCEFSCGKYDYPCNFKYNKI